MTRRVERQVLRAKVGFKVTGSIRPVTEPEEEPRLCAAASVRGIQHVRRQLLGSDRRAGCVRDRHGVAAVYQPTGNRSGAFKFCREGDPSLESPEPVQLSTGLALAGARS